MSTRSGDPVTRENVLPVIYSKDRFFTFHNQEFKLINWNGEVTIPFRANNPPTIKDRQVWMLDD